MHIKSQFQTWLKQVLSGKGPLEVKNQEKEQQMFLK